MATLTGQTIAATYDALLKVTDNGPITSSLKLITDGLGNNTALSLSSSAATITGTLSVTSTIGASNLSGTNTGDETNATIKTKLGAASASQDGYLTSTDWSTFNNKVPASRTLTINGTSYDLSADRSWTIVAGVSSFNTRTGAITLTSLDVTDALGFTPVTNARTISTTAPLSGGGDLTANRTLSISQATTSTNGYLSSTDWNTFNNKQNALTNPVTGTGTANYVAKFTGSTSIGNSLIYDSGTNVGIGIASPSGRFHSLSTGTGSNTISGVFSDGSTNGNAITISNATGLSTISATYLSTSIDSALALQTTTGGVTSERIRITAAGNVGIGTTSPSATLDVNGSITSSTNVRALRFWGGPSSFTTHSAPLHIFSSTIGTGAIARFNNTENTDSSTLTSMWLENYAGYRAEIAYTTHLNGSNIYINNTYNSGNILFSINSSEKARILNTGQFKLNGYTSTSSFTGTAAGYLAFDSSGNILTTAAPSGGISGSGTTNYVPKFTGSSAIGNSLIFDNGTNVGIGTTSPNEKLSVIGAISANNGIIVQGYSAAASGLNVEMGVVSGYAQFNAYNRSTSAYGQFRLDGSSLILNAGSAGNVGIGTSNPLYKLDISVSATGTAIHATDNTNADLFVDFPSSGISRFTSQFGTGGIFVFANGTAKTERMRITASGNVGIGTTSPALPLHVYNSAAALAYFESTNASGAYAIWRNSGTSFGDVGSALGISGSGSASDFMVASRAGSMILGTSSAERMRITSGGNVGIGIGTPASRLSVWNGEITISNLDSSYTAPMGSVGAYNANANTGGLVFKTSNSGTNAEKVRITSDGFVGIGTSSPATLLDINSSTLNDRLTLSHSGSLKAGFGVTSTGITYIYHHPSATFPMWISATGNVGIGNTSPTAKLSVAGDITVLSTGAAIAGSTESIYFAGTSNGNYLAFGTNSNERARIANDGRFQVNNTGYSSNCTATLRALTGTATDRILECITIGYSSAFYVQTNGNYFFAGSNLSDARTKKDINYFNESILDKVMKLKPASFRYKENEENIKGGFIAQDIKEIFPDLVTATKSDDEMMGVDYYGVIAILTKAIQELKLEVEELKNK